MKISVGDIVETSDGGKAFGGFRRISLERVVHMHGVTSGDGALLDIRTESLDNPNYLGLCGYVMGQGEIRETYWRADAFEAAVKMATRIRAEDGTANPYVRTKDQYSKTTRPGCL
jgi:hypothetical protein